MADIITNSNVLNVLCGTVIGGLIAVVLWFLFGTRVPGNGNAANDTRKQLESVADEQSEVRGTIERVASGLTESQGTLQDIAGTSDDLANTVGSIADREQTSADILRDSAERLEQCNGVLQEIRSQSPGNGK